MLCFFDKELILTSFITCKIIILHPNFVFPAWPVGRVGIAFS
jgi:hypothetical protein